jgi:uncharacterized protein
MDSCRLRVLLNFLGSRRRISRQSFASVISLHHTHWTTLSMTSPMPAVIVDSSVLISLAAAEQFQLLRAFYSTIHIPPAVWDEVVSVAKPYGTEELQHAHSDGWVKIESPNDLSRVQALPFSLQRGETEALALALQIPSSLLLVDDAQGRRAATALKLTFTGTVGILLRAKFEGKVWALKPVLETVKTRTTFWLSAAVYEAALKQVGEVP